MILLKLSLILNQYYGIYTLLNCTHPLKLFDRTIIKRKSRLATVILKVVSSLGRLWGKNSYLQKLKQVFNFKNLSYEKTNTLPC